MKRRFAQLISHAFGPFSMLPIILVVVPLLKADLTSSQLIILAPMLVLSLIIFPVSLFLYYYRSGKISNLDATIRKERESLYSWVTPGPWLAVLASWRWGSYDLTVLLLLLALTWLAITLFTYVEKVSVHMAVNTAAFLMINLLFRWQLWWLFPVLLAVAWSRWQLKRHTIHQLILGTLIPIVIFLTGMAVLL